MTLRGIDQAPDVSLWVQIATAGVISSMKRHRMAEEIFGLPLTLPKPCTGKRV